MKKQIALLFFLSVQAFLYAAPPHKYVRITTTQGECLLKLYEETPLHRNNFVKLVRSGYYQDLIFHRVIEHFMIQGGDPDSRYAADRQRLGEGGPEYTIPAEFNDSLFHKKGVIAAARDENPEKASSGSQFYLVQGRTFTDGGLDSLEQLRLGGRRIPADQREVYKTLGGAPHLDGNYTVFGEVISGLDVIDRIAAVETDRYDRPLQDQRMELVMLRRREAINLEREQAGLPPRDNLFTKFLDLFMPKHEPVGTPMKIVTYNVNGIRAAMRKEWLTWLQSVDPDVVCIQEIKAHPDQLIDLLLIERLGYEHYWYPAEKKGYSGTAILTKRSPTHVEYGCGETDYDREGRILRVDFDDLSVVSAYFPSGTTGEVRQAFKYRFLADFQSYSDSLLEKTPHLVVCGDFNICHRAIDIHNPVANARSSGFLPEEREWMENFIQSGYVDSFRHLNPEPHHYTWWTFRANARARNLGWRIDYNMVGKALEPRILRAGILADAIHSDHCPVFLELAD